MGHGGEVLDRARTTEIDDRGTPCSLSILSGEWRTCVGNGNEIAANSHRAQKGSGGAGSAWLSPLTHNESAFRR